jgi:UDP-N-acetyl-2-amino-2-deoxyglucuronate dehydrogenase
MPTAAVIGCGDVSVVHFDALTSLPEVQLVAVWDIDPKQLTAAATDHDVPGYGDHLTLLEEARPDAVHICTPHNQHALIAADSLERGAHVILEKPLAHTLIEGQRLVEVAERGSAKIAVCFQNRYNAPVQAMHRLLASGELGRVLGGSATVLWHRTADYDWSLKGTVADGTAVDMSGSTADVAHRGPDGWKFLIDNPFGTG